VDGHVDALYGAWQMVALWVAEFPSPRSPRQIAHVPRSVQPELAERGRLKTVYPGAMHTCDALFKMQGTHLDEAGEPEHVIKGWTNVKKEALIAGDLVLLKGV
jgi:hypothetical protein